MLQKQFILQFNVFSFSENYLQPLEKLPDDSFPTLKSLICGSMRLTWGELIKLSIVFPNLRELRAPNNTITHLNTPLENNFNSLKILDLEGNTIVEWTEICKLAVIPSLEQIILDNIQLKNIRFEKCKNQSLDFFSNLKKLSLSNNLINDVCKSRTIEGFV